MSENQTPEEVKEEVEVKEEKAPVEPEEITTVEQPEAFDKGTIISALDVQYIDISDKFTIVKKNDGWLATLSADEAKITVNLKSMRKLEYMFHSGDTIEKDKDSIIILQMVPEQEEGTTPRVSRSVSYRSRSREAGKKQTTTE